MLKWHIIKDKALFPLFITLFFTILLWLYYSFFVSYKSSEEITERFQEVFLEQEKSIDKILKNVSNNLLEENVWQLYEDKFLIDELSKQDYSIFVISGDTLLFWSNNLLPLDTLTFNQTGSSIIKLANGYFDKREITTEEYRLIGLIKVKSNFIYENQFLANKFGIPFPFSNSIEIVELGNLYQIKNIEGESLFSLNYSNYNNSSSIHRDILALLFLVLIVFIVITIYKAYQSLLPFYKSKYIFVLGFIADMAIIRLITLYFRLPEEVYSTFLFSSESLAFSIFSSSLGDLLINTILLFAISYVFHRNFNYSYLLKFRNGFVKLVLFISSFSFIVFLFHLLIYYLNSLIIDSNISFNLNEITSISFYGFLGFIIFAFLILTFVFFTLKLSILLSRLVRKKIIFLVLIIVLCTVFYFIQIQFIDNCPICFVFILLYLISFSIFESKFRGKIEVSIAIFYLLLFSVFSTYILSESSKAKEFEKRKLIAHSIAVERDPIAEYKFIQVAKEMKSDSVIADHLIKYPFQSQLDYNNLYKYITSKYFSHYWTKYDFVITICDEERLLDVQPEDYVVSCYTYFEDIISEYGQVTSCDDFYFLDYYMLSDNYLGLINYNLADNSFRIAIEVIPKNTPKGLGYPELLADSKNSNTADLSLYSWAMYENNELIYHFGKYFYSYNLSQYGSFEESKSFFNRNKYSHLYYRINEDKVVIISKRGKGLLDTVAPFSYIFIFYGIILFIMLLILKKSLNIRMLEMNFKKRVQFSLTSLIVVSFLIIGFGSLYYIVNLNNNKNHDLLNEKAHSVLIELEHKLASEETLTEEISPYLSELLYKFSLVFFSDINMYDLNGNLLASSRPEIFNKGLISTKMNSGAFDYMKNYKKSFYIHNESIGKYEYLSAYIPFRNEQNKLIAYLNLPYFAKQDELTHEISTFLVAFINIYVILIAVAIFIALVISNYITRPVQLIKEKIGGLKLGRTNDKIEWTKNDEIGSLVKEYNRMVDELAQSANLLAKSERESAWREMARQIAHEIKNPLTPMKLSVQYLQKAYDENAPDWDKRLARFTKTIVEQIDSLSIIASDFSDFATLPRTIFEKVELNEIIENSINLFRNTTEVKFEFSSKGDHSVFVDKEQVSRVFINLIKNSIQAIENPKNGFIRIIVEEKENTQIVHFSDNGSGIPEDQIEKVFSPNFTTKSGGMGLGLAMVKNIIRNSGGEITFNSTTGVGTSFFITLPKYRDE